MKCVIERNGVKVFGKAVHALARIGDELWLDPMMKGLAMRSVNSAHSAYACFLFSPLFFQHYSPDTGPAQDSGTVKCKLVMKSVLPLFRCLATIERNVDSCQISINLPDNRVIFQFHCRHGITKTHNLGFQESEALQAVFPSHLCPNVLKAQPRLLGDMVMHFPVSQEEITLSMSPLRVNLKSYYEDESDQMKAMHTEMSLDPSEFDYFQVGVDSDITFCLKELRGLLSFAESHGLPVSAHFGAAGKPVAFSVDDMVLEASVVLATLVNPESRTPSQATEAQAPAALRCGGVAEPPEGPCEADAGPPQAQGFPSAGELIASSQGSPVFCGAALMREFTRTGEDSDRLRTPRYTHRGRGITTPPSSKVRSLLFGAVSCEQGDGCTSMLPSLACSSDTEDGGEERASGAL
ncbi:cell cycle checkpoint control protein RAD9B isoform 1-T1 [Salvelinus alpinus]|uniref:cell cycle checkpoint control protein RAD9B n=1 Tax=Salvelinus sp. IW2-2015 TaxID=2691554 RepID=UPI000CDFAA26|nr:cell cycle checkpoint control protein RAD9B [Salvelinus alpinus]